MDILGNKLPAQSAYFMQLMLVHYFVGLGLELARAVPCAIAAVRRAAGPGLTPKERDAPWLGLSPLSVPGQLALPALLSDAALMFVILLTYAVLSPVTCFVMAFCFGASAVAYRSQCAFVYDPRGDGGGLLWPPAMRAVLACAVIGELIVLAVLALKEGKGQAPLVVPLPVATVLLYRYLEQRHYRAAEHLPLADCVRADRAHQADGGGAPVARGAYVQPALRRRRAAGGGGNDERGADAFAVSLKGPAAAADPPPKVFCVVDNVGAGAGAGERTASSMVYVPAGSDGPQGPGDPRPRALSARPALPGADWGGAEASAANFGAAEAEELPARAVDGGEAVEALLWPSIMGNHTEAMERMLSQQHYWWE